MLKVEWRDSSPEANDIATRRDVRVARVATMQHGLVTTRQLRDCGLGSTAISVRVARGHLHPLHRGVYAVGHRAITLTGHFAAAVLACGDGAVLSHHAAAAHLGLLSWDERLVEVTVPRAGGRAIAAIRVHRATLEPRDVWRRAGILVTSPARTLLDIAVATAPGSLRRIVRQAQAEEHVNVRQLLDVLDRHRGDRGAGRLRAVLAGGPSPTRSVLEDRVLDLIDRAGIQRPALNARLRLDGRTVIPDMLWREQRLVVECDGARWHDDPLSQQLDAERQALLEAHGHLVLRVRWRQTVEHPDHAITRITDGLTRTQPRR